MKRKLVLTALALGASSVLASCGGATKTETAKAEGTESAAVEEKKAEENTAGNKPNVAILLNGTLGDKAFYDSAANGARMMQEELGLNVKTVEMTYDETKWMPTLIDFSEDKDTDIIIVGTWQMNEKLQEVAPQYPDKKYIIFDSAVDYTKDGMENVYSVEYKQNECSFLAGAAAAMSTKTGTLGFVGGMENYVVNDFLVGYVQGAKYVKDDIKINIGYVGNFNDTAKAKELTLAQINQNADIVYQVASTAGLGVIDGVTEKDKLAIGVDSDQAEAFMETDKEKAEHILTSALKRVDLSLFRAIKLETEGKLAWGTREVLGIKEGAVGIAQNSIYDSLASDETKKTVAELEEKINSGEIEVDTAFGKSTDEIQKIKDSVRP